MPGRVESLELPIEYAALVLTVVSLVLALATLAWLVHSRLNKPTTSVRRPSKFFWGLVAGNVLIILIAVWMLLVNHVDSSRALGTMLLVFIAFMPFLFILVSVEFLKAFVLTGHISSRTIKLIRIGIIVVHIGLATPLYLRAILYFNSKADIWAAAWYRATAGPWFLSAVIYDFLQCAWVARTLWRHLKEMQSLQIHNLRQFNISTKPDSTANNTSAVAVLPPNDGANAPVPDSDSSSVSSHLSQLDSSDPRVRLYKAYRIAIVSLGIFFAFDVISVVLFQLSGTYEAPAGTTSQRISIALSTIASANFCFHFVAAIFYFDNLRRMMTARDASAAYATGTTTTFSADSKSAHATQSLSASAAPRPDAASMA
ncbi:hypothetical protein BC831DRAFT_505202 [Entophlyctis helioformis]|nr:hypothetical protein BC831DRAFT_505202 [Entophlyctis helioformis]